MRARVEVSFKDGVLDPEAVTIARSLASLGFAEVRAVRRAKVIELDLATPDRHAAESLAKVMCDQLLANPVIESYRISVVE